MGCRRYASTMTRLNASKSDSLRNICVLLGPGKESAPFLRIWGALLDRSLIRSSLSEAHFKSRLVVCFVRRERLGW
jgi:hypothetical protein